MAATLQLEGRSEIRVIDVENQGRRKDRERKGRKITMSGWKHEKKSESK
jgi:hypothetical protein